jgi:hypothetical protein
VSPSPEKSRLANARAGMVPFLLRQGNQHRGGWTRPGSQARRAARPPDPHRWALMHPSRLTRLNPGRPRLRPTTRVVPETSTLDGKPSSFESDKYKPAAADNPAYCPSHRDVSQIDQPCYHEVARLEAVPSGDPQQVERARIRYPATGEPIAASGLRLLSRDFAKLGRLVLSHGLGRQADRLRAIPRASDGAADQRPGALFLRLSVLARTLVHRRARDQLERRGRSRRSADLRRPDPRSGRRRQCRPLPQPAPGFGAARGAEPLRASRRCLKALSQIADQP